MMNVSEKKGRMEFRTTFNEMVETVAVDQPRELDI
jgi:hypothetical protein